MDPTRKNQSDAHRELVERSYLWLANRAYRDVRATSEFCPPNGYSADLVALMQFRGEKFNQRYIPDPVLYNSMCVLVFEAKASRPDLRAKFGEKANVRTDMPMGHLHWIVATDGLMDKAEAPKFWGLLERRGSILRELKKPTYCPMTRERMMEISVAMLWAEDNMMRHYECCRVMEIVRAMQKKEETNEM